MHKFPNSFDEAITKMVDEAIDFILNSNNEIDSFDLTVQRKGNKPEMVCTLTIVKYKDVFKAIYTAIHCRTITELEYQDRETMKKNLDTLLYTGSYITLKNLMEVSTIEI